MLVTRAILDIVIVAAVVMLGVKTMRSPLWTGDRRDKAIAGLSFCVGLLTLNSAAVNGLRWTLPPWLRLVELALILVVVVTLNVSFLRERRELTQAARRVALAKQEHRTERDES